jgi:hypothetical protein
MLIEGPRFSFRFAPDISAEEWAEMAHAVCKIIVEGRPQTPQRRRQVAIRTAMALYQGPPSRRAKDLADRYRAYLASGWLRERDLETLPEPRSTERVLLHRIARLNNGRALCARAAITASRLGAGLIRPLEFENRPLMSGRRERLGTVPARWYPRN